MAGNANFKNPVGLVLRMLKSGSPPARNALLRAALRYGTLPVDWLMSARESRIVEQSKSHASLPLILIVGPPRGGTTLVFQVLARALDVSVTTNLSSLFFRSPIVATRTFRKWVRFNSTNLQNYFGQTAGLDGPNDAFPIWNRWLGTDRYVTDTDMSETDIHAMQNFFRAWTWVFKKPLLNKNNRNTHCMAFLADNLPSAYFVVVNRDPVEIARSLIRARETIQGSKTIRWGLLSQQQRANDGGLGYVNDVCEQIRSINKSLAEQLQRIPSERVLPIDYHDFCSNPQEAVQRLLEIVPDLERSKAELAYDPTLTASKAVPLSQAEESRIQECFQDLPQATAIQP